MKICWLALIIFIKNYTDANQTEGHEEDEESYWFNQLINEMAQTVPFLPVWEHHSHLPASINTKRSNIHRLLSLSLLLIVSAGYWLFSCFLCCSLIKLLLMLPQHCRSKYIESNKRRNSVCTSSLYLQSGENKLAKLRRHASRIHFALTHFGKIHFKEIHFVADQLTGGEGPPKIKIWK